MINNFGEILLYNKKINLTLIKEMTEHFSFYGKILSNILE
jgi:hypothetical protein